MIIPQDVIQRVIIPQDIESRRAKVLLLAILEALFPNESCCFSELHSEVSSVQLHLQSSSLVPLY